MLYGIGSPVAHSDRLFSYYGELRGLKQLQRTGQRERTGDDRSIRYHLLIAFMAQGLLIKFDVIEKIGSILFSSIWYSDGSKSTITFTLAAIAGVASISRATIIMTILMDHLLIHHYSAHQDPKVA